MRSRSPIETRALARGLGRAIAATTGRSAPAVAIGLVGPLGVGKTEWVKGLAEGLGVDPRLVASPTFVIASEYPGGRPLAHVDLYRLESEAELDATGFLDLLAPGRVVAVEWADRLPGALPADHIEVRIARTDADARDIEARAEGPLGRRIVAAWQAGVAEEERAPWR